MLFLHFDGGRLLPAFGDCPRAWICCGATAPASYRQGFEALERARSGEQAQRRVQDGLVPSTQFGWNDRRAKRTGVLLV